MKLTQQDKEYLASKSIILALEHYNIKNETGDKVDFHDHLWQYDIYKDFSPKIAVQKPAQVGLSLLQIIKVMWAVKNLKLDAIYTLPTVADAKNMASGKFNRIIANNPIMQGWTQDKDSVEQKQIGDNMLYIRGCVDEETELLTMSGWKKHSEVVIGETLPTLNIETNSVEMDTVLDMTVFDADEDMVSIDTKDINQLVTTDHRCVIAKRLYSGEKSELRIVRANELLGKKTAYIPLTHNPFVKTDKIDSYYSVLGWVIGDGSYWTKRDKYKDKVYESPRVCIIQKKLTDDLEKDLHDAGIKYYIVKRKDGSNIYKLSAKDSKEIRSLLPEKKLTFNLLDKATDEQINGLYKGLMYSDGDNTGNGFFYQNNNGTCDAFQLLLILKGKTSSKNTRNEKKEIITIKKKKWCNPKTTLVKYKGIAWCPTTKNGTIFIRRNGIVSVTGQTWTDKAAMMVSSDLNIYDEVDASKQDIIDAYSTRLQHSDKGWEWWFSHPSIEGFGVNKHFMKSDQKHWFIKCPHCSEEQHLTFPENIDLEQEIYICKHCNGELQDEDRRKGRWVKKYKDREISGYQITSMMCSWISAKKIKEYYLNKSEEYFYTKVLGLPYVGKGNTVNETKIYDCVEDTENDRNERIVIGCDTGLTQWYVMGNKNGIFYYGSSKGYEEIESILKDYRNAILVMDAKGDLTQPRILQEKYPNRVFLCEYRQDRKTQQLVTWGTNKETGTVVADRNRMIQLVVDEFDRGLMTLNGSKDEYHDYVEHFKNIYRIEEDDMLGIPRRKWERKGDDHLVHATVYWRIGMSKYANTAGVLMKQSFGDIPVHDSITVIGDKGIVTNTKSHEWRLY